MCTTPAPPSTAVVAASIWSGTGDVNTAPGQAASSIPRPTNPPCMGSWPAPPPETMATLPCLGASARTTICAARSTRRMSPWATASPARDSGTAFSGSFSSLRMDIWAPPRWNAGAANLTEPPQAGGSVTFELLDAELFAQQAVDFPAVRAALGLTHDRAHEGAHGLRVAAADALDDVLVLGDDLGHDLRQLAAVLHDREPLGLGDLGRVVAGLDHLVEDGTGGAGRDLLGPDEAGERRELGRDDRGLARVGVRAEARAQLRHPDRRGLGVAVALHGHALEVRAPDRLVREQVRGVLRDAVVG